LLTRACDVFARLCVGGIEADRERCRQHVDTATAAATALIDVLGYEKVQQLATKAQAEGKPIRQVVVEETSLTEADFDALVAPERVTRLGSQPPTDDGKGDTP
jgi:aspartate ammonia-lyase